MYGCLDVTIQFKFGSSFKWGKFWDLQTSVRLAFCTYLINVNIDTKESRLKRKKLNLKVSFSQISRKYEFIFVNIVSKKKEAFCAI